MSVRCASRTLPAAAAILAIAGTAACVSRAGPVHLKGGGLVPIAGVSPEAIDAAARPRRIALLIGIDTFDDHYWPTLRWAAKDADDLGAALSDPKIGGFDEVRVLTRPESTTRQSVLAALAHLKSLAPRADDTVIVYVSSHGTLAPTPSGRLERTLVLRDTRHDKLLDTGLPMAVLEKAFDAIPSKRKALVLAACDSGSGSSLLTPAARRLMHGVKGALPELETVSHASLVMSASEFEEPAREDDRLENDVYTHFLVQALVRGADANGDGAVSATEAHDYARRRTYEYTGGKQIPTVEAAVVGADPVLLAGRVDRPGLPVLYSYAAGLDGYQVKSGGREKGVLPGNVVLEPGAQDIEVSHDGKAIYEGRVVLEPGQRLSVSNLLDAAKPRYTVGLRYGAFALLNTGIGLRVLRPVSGPALTLRLRDLPWPRLDPFLTIGMGGGDQSVLVLGQWHRQSVFVLRVGLGAAYTRHFGPLRLYAGPHVAWISVNRDLSQSVPAGRDQFQPFATVMTGVVAGGAYRFGRFELQLEGQLHYLPLIWNGKLANTATGSFTAGVGFRF